MIAVIYADYEEGDLSSYKGCGVRVHGEQVHFASKGDFAKDMISCCVYCAKNKLVVYWSSSIDHIQSERHQAFRASLKETA